MVGVAGAAAVNSLSISASSTNKQRWYRRENLMVRYSALWKTAITNKADLAKAGGGGRRWLAATLRKQILFFWPWIALVCVNLCCVRTMLRVCYVNPPSCPSLPCLAGIVPWLTLTLPPSTMLPFSKPITFPYNMLACYVAYILPSHCLSAELLVG